MTKKEPMPLKERCRLHEEASVYYDAGDFDEYLRLSMMIPIESQTARTIASYYGKEYVLKNGYDLSVADYEMGEGWLDKYDSIDKFDLHEELTDEIEEEMLKDLW